MSSKFVVPTLGAVVFGVLMLNMTAFCWQKGHYLSDRELFEAAISYEGGAIGDYSSTDSPASYLEKHPNCCSIAKLQPPNLFLATILGSRPRYIRIAYRLSQAEIDSSHAPPNREIYQSFVEITPCGRAFHHIGLVLDDGVVE